MNNDRWIRIANEFGTDLSSRTRARHLRRRIAAAIDSGCAPVTVDLAGVRTLSNSFADEAFAVLVHDRSERWFDSNVRFVGESEHVKTSIASAIAYRCEPA
jgi:hypothetical protein